jgi:AcrR family transcriptional regulator
LVLSPRRLTRDESKRITRRRLVDGAIDILRRDGVAAATTGRIASAAGIQQSSFYGHFRDRDACLAAAAESIGEVVLAQVRDQRAALDPRDLRGSVRAALAAIVASFLREPELTRIFLRYRADVDSPLGASFRSLIDRAREGLSKDVRLLGIAATQSHADVLTDLLIAATFGLVEGLVDGRLDDRELAIDALADVIHAALRAAVPKR